jgi:Recombination endonuclease VII
MSVSQKYKRDPVKKKEYDRQWRGRNSEKLRGYRKKFRAKHPEKIKHNSYKTNYGISYDAVFEMWLEQERRCKCCDEEIGFPARTTHLDHCHKTKTIRGLVCARCNAMIGYAGDSIDLLRRAITYLR